MFRFRPCGDKDASVSKGAVSKGVKESKDFVADLTRIDSLARNGGLVCATLGHVVHETGLGIGTCTADRVEERVVCVFEFLCHTLLAKSVP